MNRRHVVVAFVLSALTLASCKGDSSLHVYNLAPEAGTAPGYKGGTPVTLADGTFVTLPNGTKVTTPVVPGNRTSTSRRGSVSLSGGEDGDPSTPDDNENDTGSTGTTTPRQSTTSSTYLASTGTTTQNPFDGALRYPSLGLYRFTDTVTPDDGSPGTDGDRFFNYTSNAERVVRVQESDASGTPRTQGYYEERHDPDGLWLTASALPSGVCRWDPKSASLPKKVIQGGSVETKVSCSAGGTTLELTTRVTFKSVRNVTIAGKTYRCIDVTRYRVLTDAKSTITSDAVDTYSFDLGMRVASSEHSTTRTDQGETGFVRTLVLVAPPA